MNKEMWLIWKQPQTRRRYKVGSLIYDGKNYSFKYTTPELDEAKDAGFRYFPGFEDLSKNYSSSQLFANIHTRLPNKARPDYLEILNYYNLESDASELEILKATKGRLVTDYYEFVPAFHPNKIEFNVAGTRHCPDINACKQFIHINDKLELELDSCNKYDKYAIKVIYNKANKKYHLGYVPRYYSKELTKLLKENANYSAMIQSIHFESKMSDENILAFVKLIFK